MAIQEIPTAQQSIALAAKFAYGSGMLEGTKGGEGNIGLLGGRIFKFNTHWSERGGAVTEAMRKSCNDLRRQLCENAEEVLNHSNLAKGAMNAEIRRIRAMLGLDVSGNVVDTGLLSRKTVAKVVTRLGKMTGTNFWDGDGFNVNRFLRFGDGSGHDPGNLSSRGLSTSFVRVAEPMIKRVAARYVADHLEDFDSSFETLGIEILKALRGKTVSLENQALIKSVLYKSVEDYIAKNGPLLEGALAEGGVLRGP